MISVYSPVKHGFIVNQDGQFDIRELIVRGNTNLAVRAAGQQGREELAGGIDVDLPSFVEFCKRVLVETGAMPKWFFIGVIVDSNHSQLLTYFNPSKEKFFSDIYNFIKENLAGNLPMAETETVVKHFFESNPDYHFSYLMIPLDALLTGSAGGWVEQTDIRI